MCRNPMGDDEDGSTPLFEGGEICGIKEALCAQQQLLQKLYNELDAEREASASAASEALAVILRLQGEKAAVKMEAEHYKRLSEEKICHAEESLAMVEDAIYQKEMEVAALDYQVQAYKYKLLSLGCVDDDHGYGGLKFLDGFLQRHEGGSAGEAGACGGDLGRRHSAPMPRRGKRDRDGGVLEGRMVEEMCGKDSDSEKKIDSYWEKIRRLDERVKEIAGDSINHTNSRSGMRPAPLSSSCVSRGSSCDPSCSARNELGVMEGSDKAKCSTSVHDVFEVPRAEGSSKSCESMGKDGIKKMSEGLEKGDDESGWLRRVLQSSSRSSFEKKLCRVSGDVECRLVIVPPASGVSGFSSSTMARDKGISEVVECSERGEELKLLHEIKERVDLLHDEIRSLKQKENKSSSSGQETSLDMVVLSEAMLHFWL